MEIDLELYRRDVYIPVHPPIRLSVIDISPERPASTLMFIHGFGGKATQWQYQLAAFSRSNRVIAMDLRGHGRSERPRGRYTMSHVQRDLLALLDNLNVSRCVLVGHSFGGAVAAQLAHAHPERVEKLVLIATAGEFRLNPLYRFLLSLPRQLLRFASPYTRAWLGAPPHVLQRWYADNLTRWNGWSIFRSLQLPTLVIRGYQDAVFSRPVFEEVARAIPDAEDFDVGASGHLVMLERRDAVNRAIYRFLGASSGTWSPSHPSEEDVERTALVQERPWLSNYEKDVPYTIAVPPVPIQHILASAARRFPTHTAIMFEGFRLSYRRLLQEANRFANALLALGLHKGDRVMLITPNLPQMVISFFGILKAGGVAVFTMPTHNPEELIRQIRESEARILVTLTQFDNLIYEIKNQLESSGTSPLRHVIFVHVADYLPFHKRMLLALSRQQRIQHLLDIPMDADMHIFSQMLYKFDKHEPEVDISPGELAVIQFTGGTTATPKGVMLSHANLLANTLQTRSWLPEARAGAERFLSVLPFSHSYGLTTALNVPISMGATLILKAKFETADILKTIQKYKPTIFPGVPQMYVAIKDFPGARKFGISSIKACVSGSAPLPVEVQEAFEKLTRGRLVEGYGLTEATTVTHANPLNGLRKIGSIGVPIPSTEARLVDLTSGKTEVPAGQIGELAVRGPQVMLGYWHDEEATRQVITDGGWLLSGDVAQVDAQGYFRIVARKADMWYPSRPGIPAFPRDVEEVLFEVPQVKEVAVVAIAGQPVAFVIARKGGPERPSAEALIAYCKRRLPPDLVPRLVVFVEDFPRTLIGKVIRRELARRFQLTHPELSGEPVNPPQSLSDSSKKETV